MPNAVIANAFPKFDSLKIKLNFVNCLSFKYFSPYATFLIVTAFRIASEIIKFSIFL